MNRDVRRVFALLALTTLFFWSQGVVAATRWDNPLPQGNILADVEWGGSPGRFVAVGNAGTILESQDGVQWTQVVSNTTEWLEAVTWTGSQFVVVGNSGTILTSSDGHQWMRQSSGTSSYLYDVEPGSGNRLVVVGSSGTVLTSDDGVHWTRRDSGVSNWLNDVVWNGAEFIAVGSHATVVASRDGLSWVVRNNPLRTADGKGPGFDGIAWGNNRWVVVAEDAQDTDGYHSLSSTDGINWSVGSTGTGLHAVYATPSGFVAVGAGGGVLTTTDGIAWTSNNTGFGESLESVSEANGAYVAVGEHGLILSTTTPAARWMRRTTGQLTSLASVAVAGQGYTAVGNGILAHRTDMAVGGAGVTVRNDVPNLRGIAAGEGAYVAVGSGAIVRIATDGTWSRDTAPSRELRDVAHTGNGSWIAVGDNGVILQYTGGRGWEEVRTGNESLKSVTTDGSRLVAVGTRGTTGIVLTSSNGATWASEEFPDHDLRGVASNNSGRVVIVGDQGNILTRVNSTFQPVEVDSAFAFNDVTWDGRRFIAVGSDGATFFSSDGLHWAKKTITGNTLYGVASGVGSLVVVGEGGTVVRTSCPCATDDVVHTAVNTSVRIAVLANDVGDNLRVNAVNVRTAQGGKVTRNGDGTVTYTPARDFSGKDVFNYTIGSTTMAGTDTAAVEVTVNGSRRGGGGGGGSASLLGVVLLATMRKMRIKFKIVA